MRFYKDLKVINNVAITSYQLAPPSGKFLVNAIYLSLKLWFIYFNIFFITKKAANKCTVCLMLRRYRSLWTPGHLHH